MMLLPTVIVRNFVALPLQNDVVEVMNTNTAGDGVSVIIVMEIEIEPGTELHCIHVLCIPISMILKLTKN